MAEATKKKRQPIITTPAGKAKYPKLTEPDTKFKDAGEYSVKLLIPQEEAQPLIDRIEEELKVAIAEAKEAREGKRGKAAQFEAKNKPYEVDEDEEGEPTGMIAFKFAMTASGVNKKTNKPWERKPTLFDAAGTPITDPNITIWGGSRLKVAFQFSTYDTAAAGVGVSMRLEAVQIIELVGPGQRDAAGYGFGEEEGYTHTAEDKPAFGGGPAPAGGEGEPGDGDF